MFGFPTHKSKIKVPASSSGSARHRKVAQSLSHQHPEVFLRSLFFREPKTSPLIRELTNDRDRRDSGSRKSARRPVKRASTLASPAELSHEGSVSTPPTIMQQPTDSTDDSFLEASTLASSRRPFATPASTLRRPNAPRMQTEPSPLLSIFSPSLGPRPSSAGHASHMSTSGPNVLPKALVVSGLEYSNMPSQRALMQVLNERKLTLDGDDVVSGHSDHDHTGETWNLPEDFICVYVCPSHPYERPDILPGLVSCYVVYGSMCLTGSY